jgi:hypothetical protein
MGGEAEEKDDGHGVSYVLLPFVLDTRYGFPERIGYFDSEVSSAPNCPGDCVLHGYGPHVCRKRFGSIIRLWCLGIIGVLLVPRQAYG